MVWKLLICSMYDYNSWVLWGFQLATWAKCLILDWSKSNFRAIYQGRLISDQEFWILGLFFSDVLPIIASGYIQAEETDGKREGPMLYGFHSSPSLDVRTTWTGNHSASIVPYLYKVSSEHLFHGLIELIKFTCVAFANYVTWNQTRLRTTWSWSLDDWYCL